VNGRNRRKAVKKSPIRDLQPITLLEPVFDPLVLPSRTFIAQVVFFPFLRNIDFIDRYGKKKNSRMLILTNPMPK
jgi:hypothetical protein